MKETYKDAVKDLAIALQGFVDAGCKVETVLPTLLACNDLRLDLIEALQSWTGEDTANAHF